MWCHCTPCGPSGAIRSCMCSWRCLATSVPLGSLWAVWCLFRAGCHTWKKRGGRKKRKQGSGVFSIGTCFLIRWKLLPPARPCSTRKGKQSAKMNCRCCARSPFLLFLGANGFPLRKGSLEGSPNSSLPWSPTLLQSSGPHEKRIGLYWLFLDMFGALNPFGPNVRNQCEHTCGVRCCRFAMFTFWWEKFPKSPQPIDLCSAGSRAASKETGTCSALS